LAGHRPAPLRHTNLAKKQGVASSAEVAILVGLDLKSRDSAMHAQESLEELKALALSAGARVAESQIQSRSRAEASTLVGSGKVEELKAKIHFHEATVVIFDRDLTPTQQRNLESALEVKVLDRTQLILDIFARRARTREGQLQVELAQLNYLLPRLTGHGAAMSRLGGGIGTRGPGETKLETDRRRIHQRLAAIGKDLERVRGGRATQRRQRQGVPLATVALVGYTNAGKSTLFNRLTGAKVLADAKMFATLDPTVRHATLPSHRRVLFSDTVGFIRNLPTMLVKAFRATLEEVVEAELLLHVVDASFPGAAEHTAHVIETLSQIKADHTPQILVLNKVDLIPGEADAQALARRILGDPEHQPAAAVAVSAQTGAGMEALLQKIDETLPLDRVSVSKFRFPLGEGAPLHLLHEHGQVTATRYRKAYCEVEALASDSLRRRLAKYLVTGGIMKTRPG
jgi:GTP-binding protein HflX